MKNKKFGLSADFDAKSIGKMLIEGRKSVGKTQKDIADCTGLSERTIGRMERGEHDPNTMTIKKYVEAIGGNIQMEILIS